MNTNRSNPKNYKRAAKLNVSLSANEALLTNLNKFWYGNHLFIQPEDKWQLPYKEPQPNKKKRKVSKIRNYYQYRNYNPYYYNYNYYNDYYNVNPLYPALAHYHLQTYERFRTAKVVNVPAEIDGDQVSATNQIPVPNLADQLLRIKRQRILCAKRSKRSKRKLECSAPPVNCFQRQRKQQQQHCQLLLSKISKISKNRC